MSLAYSPNPYIPLSSGSKRAAPSSPRTYAAPSTSSASHRSSSHSRPSRVTQQQQQQQHIHSQHAAAIKTITSFRLVDSPPLILPSGRAIITGDTSDSKQAISYPPEPAPPINSLHVSPLKPAVIDWEMFTQRVSHIFSPSPQLPLLHRVMSQFSTEHIQPLLLSMENMLTESKDATRRNAALFQLNTELEAEIRRLKSRVEELERDQLLMQGQVDRRSAELSQKSAEYSAQLLLLRELIAQGIHPDLLIDYSGGELESPEARAKRLEQAKNQRADDLLKVQQLIDHRTQFLLDALKKDVAAKMKSTEAVLFTCNAKIRALDVYLSKQKYRLKKQASVYSAIARGEMTLEMMEEVRRSAAADEDFVAEQQREAAQAHAKHSTKSELAWLDLRDTRPNAFACLTRLQARQQQQWHRMLRQAYDGDLELIAEDDWDEHVVTVMTDVGSGTGSALTSPAHSDLMSPKSSSKSPRRNKSSKRHTQTHDGDKDKDKDREKTGDGTSPTHTRSTSPGRKPSIGRRSSLLSQPSLERRQSLKHMAPTTSDSAEKPNKFKFDREKKPKKKHHVAEPTSAGEHDVDSSSSAPPPPDSDADTADESEDAIAREEQQRRNEPLEDATDKDDKKHRRDASTSSHASDRSRSSVRRGRRSKTPDLESSSSRASSSSPLTTPRTVARVPSLLKQPSDSTTPTQTSRAHSRTHSRSASRSLSRSASRSLSRASSVAASSATSRIHSNIHSTASSRMTTRRNSHEKLQEKEREKRRKDKEKEREKEKDKDKSTAETFSSLSDIDAALQSSSQTQQMLEQRNQEIVERIKELDRLRQERSGDEDSDVSSMTHASTSHTSQHTRDTSAWSTRRSSFARSEVSRLDTATASRADSRAENKEHKDDKMSTTSSVSRSHLNDDGDLTDEEKVRRADAEKQARIERIRVSTQLERQKKELEYQRQQLEKENRRMNAKLKHLESKKAEMIASAQNAQSASSSDVQYQSHENVHRKVIARSVGLQVGIPFTYHHQELERQQERDRITEAVGIPSITPNTNTSLPPSFDAFNSTTNTSLHSTTIPLSTTATSTTSTTSQPQQVPFDYYAQLYPHQFENIQSYLQGGLDPARAVSVEKINIEQKETHSARKTSPPPPSLHDSLSSLPLSSSQRELLFQNELKKRKEAEKLMSVFQRIQARGATSKESVIHLRHLVQEEKRVAMEKILRDLELLREQQERKLQEAQQAELHSHIPTHRPSTAKRSRPSTAHHASHRPSSGSAAAAAAVAAAAGNVAIDGDISGWNGSDPVQSGFHAHSGSSSRPTSAAASSRPQTAHSTASNKSSSRRSSTHSNYPHVQHYAGSERRNQLLTAVLGERRLQIQENAKK